jgi:hypothetical protein
MKHNSLRSMSSRPFVRARALVAVCTVSALVGIVVVAPAAFAVAPDAPTLVSALPGDGQITVAFTPPINGSPTSFTASCPSSNGGTLGSLLGAASPLVVTGLTNGRTYTCSVVASNIDGDSMPSSTSAALVPSGVPGTPDAPTATAGNTQISVAFTPPPNNGSPITKFLATCTSQNDGSFSSKPGTASPITVTGLNNGSPYTCTVVATNSDGNGGASTPSAPVTPVTNATAPGAPSKPAVAAGDGQIRVTFSAPASDGNSPITGYTSNCTSPTGTAGNASSGGSPIFVSGLDNGNSYTCTVLASNGVGNGVPSPASAAVVPSGLPGTPPQPLIIAGDQRATVNFVAASNNGSAISRYTATCTSQFDGAIISQFGTSSPIVVTDLTNGTTYNCTVTAHNANGDGGASPGTNVTPARGPDTPAQPGVVAGNRQITVSFSAPGNGGSPITGYTALCTTGTAHVSKTGLGAPIVVAGLTNGVAYTCTIAATNANSTSAPSPASAAVVPSTVPNAPGTPRVVAGNATIDVSFGAPANGGAAITRYVGSCSSTNGGRSSTGAGAGTPFRVGGLTNGKTYRCFVFAQNARGSSARSGLSAAVVPSGLITIQSTQRGFRLFAGDGGVFTFGVDQSFGSAANVATHTVVGMASTPSTKGYWLVATDGGIFSFGDARFWGSTGAMHLNQPIVGMTPTPSGHGYWLVASDGGIFSFGDARFWGSTGAIRLNQPIVGMSATPTGHGYWLVATDGGLFAFGDARFHGTPVGLTHSQVVGMATTIHGGGYWIAAADGSVYNFGDAPALGGVTVRATRLPVRGIASTPSGHGYWLAAGDGGVFTFGDAPFVGWPGPLVLRAQIMGVSR